MESVCTTLKPHLFRFGQFAAHPVEVYDALRGVGVSQDFGVELAEPVCFALRELVPRGQNSDLVEEIVIRFSIPLSVCQISRQPGLYIYTHINTSSIKLRGASEENCSLIDLGPKLLFDHFALLQTRREPAGRPLLLLERLLVCCRLLLVLGLDFIDLL